MKKTGWIGRASAGLLLPLLFAGLCWTATGRLEAQTAEPGQIPQQTTAGEQPRSAAQELVHESREAAGEDEHAKFKHSASVQLIARLTGLSLDHAYWLSVILNFAVIAIGLAWVARKKLPGVFRDRTSAIQKAMEEARKASEEAQRRLADVERRLMRLDAEIGQMHMDAEKEAAAEEARIKAAAEEDRRKIVQGAQQEISAAAKAARRDLSAFAADLAVSLAQKQIQVDVKTDQSLVQDFAGQLSSQTGGKDGR
ncbi:MAG: ATP synthase F0 subunit B [Acidobacteria bacterium]|jgi:F-type H+-transporting ATPase subunit b|nr:ATP synthase F0 subunit B [Acidobacteriota bacterium]